MEISFKNLQNTNVNKIGLCIASGPSLNQYKKIIENISIKNRNKFSLFSVNEVDEWFNFNSDYRVFANNEQTIVKNFKQFRKNKKSTIVFADTVDLTKKWIYKFLLFGLDYLPYDQRHFNSKTCKPISLCCKRIQEHRLTIQEELQLATNHNIIYGTGHTVALHMLALSILTGCKTIYIFGVDLNYKIGYANPNVFNHTSFDEYLIEIIQDFDIIYKSAKNIGVEIFSTSKNSPINNVIPFKEFEI
jgi:hypothetical protein